MDALSQDLRVGLRRMQRAPTLTTAIVLTIGLGLGAAAAIFTASDAALVEPLPYAEPERLVHLSERRSGTDERSPTSYPTFLDWRLRAKSFAALERERFARSLAGSSALDRTIVVNGTPFVVVGVLPHAFHFALLQDADIFVPLVADAPRRADRLQRSIHVIGRLQGRGRLSAA